MGTLEMGLSEEELRPLVSAWRSNPNIVKFWWDVDRAAMKAVRDRTDRNSWHSLRLSKRDAVYHASLRQEAFLR